MFKSNFPEYITPQSHMFSATSLSMSRILLAIGVLRYTEFAKEGSGGRALLPLQ